MRCNSLNSICSFGFKNLKENFYFQIALFVYFSTSNLSIISMNTEIMLIFDSYIFCTFTLQSYLSIFCKNTERFSPELKFSFFLSLYLETSIVFCFFDNTLEISFEE